MKTAKTDRPVTVYFIVCCAVLFLIAAAFLPELSYDDESGGLRVVPDILFCLAVSQGLLDEDRRRAGVMALVTGVLCDVFIMPPSHLSPLLFTLGACFAPCLFRYFTKKSVLTATVSALPFFAARLICGAVFLLSEHRELTLGTALTEVLLPEFGLNAVCMLVLYAVVRFGYTRVYRKFC